MQAKIKTYTAWFWRPSSGAGAKEIGPQNEFREIEARSLTAAKREAREIAKIQGWRLNEVEPKNGGEVVVNPLLLDVEKLINQ